VAAGSYEWQMIDPSVFFDVDGAAYLYWGSGNAYGVRLGEDMVSFDAGQVVTWKPGNYREAAWVHHHAGVYYLSWSENDTREEDYRVAYATGPGPLGPWTERGILLARQPGDGILGTGHHSIAQDPDTGSWYIAYHRFAMRGGNGYHREVIIDRLVHRRDGTLAPVTPTLRGVARR
jgi:beta-xylosidase